MMKCHIMIGTMLALAVSDLRAAQAQPNQADMNAKACHDMMKGMDMRGMDMQNMDAKSGQNMIKGINAACKRRFKGHPPRDHRTVKSVDPAAGTVTLAHGPVKSLNSPAMTMGF